MPEEVKGDEEVNKDLRYVEPKTPSRTVDDEIRSLCLYTVTDFNHITTLLKERKRKPIAVCILTHLNS